MKVHEILDWTLRITGILAILKFIFQILFYKNKWSDNVRIVRTSDFREKECEYNAIFCFGDFLETATIVEGNVFPIKKLRVYECRLYKKKLRKDKLLYSHADLQPGQAVFLHLDYGCAMPRYIVEITNYNYEKAEIILGENGFNGNVNHEKGIEYKSTFLSKIYNSLFN